MIWAYYWKKHDEQPKLLLRPRDNSRQVSNSRTSSCLRCKPSVSSRARALRLNIFLIDHHTYNENRKLPVEMMHVGCFLFFDLSPSHRFQHWWMKVARRYTNHWQKGGHSDVRVRCPSLLFPSPFALVQWTHYVESYLIKSAKSQIIRIDWAGGDTKLYIQHVENSALKLTTEFNQRTPLSVPTDRASSAKPRTPVKHHPTKFVHFCLWKLELAFHSWGEGRKQV